SLRSLFSYRVAPDAMRCCMLGAASGGQSKYSLGKTKQMRLRSIALPVCAFVCLSFLHLSSVKGQQPAAPRAIAVDDVFEIHNVGDPQISDDGWVAYTVSTMSLKEDKSETRIWMAPAAGGEPVVMTAPKVSSTHPRWSPDGKSLAF